MLLDLVHERESVRLTVEMMEERDAAGSIRATVRAALGSLVHQLEEVLYAVGIVALDGQSGGERILRRRFPLEHHELTDHDNPLADHAIHIGISDPHQSELLDL
jgi:hypothetical protein